MNRNNPDALNHLDEIRRLVFKGEISNAEELASKVLIGVPDGQRHYEPLGDLYLVSRNSDLDVEDYRRELDLENAIASVRYTSGSVEYHREYFTSYPDQLLVIRQSSSIPGNLSISTLFGRGTVLEPTLWSDILKHPVGFHAYLDNYGCRDCLLHGRISNLPRKTTATAYSVDPRCWAIHHLHKLLLI
ncbi:glycoside hydrolase family 95 protein [Paenibacillus sp. XY044]|uniref:glycoside hydrolase family 95 protein n=1 Tax=Paenibacillus sp. XY044 TaxID=2026089 RepID=UPI00211B10F4|nr:glycoside hydrolase family 95 protein [Paenibacillus sp. XY044]